MPGNVSSNTSPTQANPYSKIWQQSSPYLQQLGFDSKYSTQIGNILNGNAEAILTDTTNQVVGNLVSDPVAKEIVSGAVDIVKTVLLGNYNKGKDIKEAKQNLSDMNAISSASNQLADAGNNATNQVVQTLQNDMNSKSSEIDESSNVVITNVQEGSSQIEELEEKNKETVDTINKNQEQIDQNNAQIQEKQQRLNELASQISAKKAQLGIKSQTPAKPQPLPQPNNTDNPSENDGVKPDSSQQSFTLMSTDGIEDSELQALISEYNGLGVEITGLQQQNTALSSENISNQETLATNVETTQENITQSIEVSQEQLDKIDAAANEIVSMSNDANAAINEIQNMLKGQFPQFDKLTLVKLSTAVAKAAVCGTNSGLLATAAATMGVSSIFSFGSTAAKAAELASASTDQGKGSAEYILAEVGGKALRQQMTQYLNKTFADISNMAGVDLTQITSFMTQYVQEQANTSKDSLAQFTQLAQSKDFIKKDDNDTSVA